MQSISLPRQHIGHPSYQKIDLVDCHESNVFLTILFFYRETLNIIWIILWESGFDKIDIMIKNPVVWKKKFPGFKNFSGTMRY